MRTAASSRPEPGLGAAVALPARGPDPGQRNRSCALSPLRGEGGMTRLRTAPTKSALLNLRKQVRFLERRSCPARAQARTAHPPGLPAHQGIPGPESDRTRGAAEGLSLVEHRPAAHGRPHHHPGHRSGASPSTSMKVLPRRSLGVSVPVGRCPGGRTQARRAARYRPQFRRGPPGLRPGGGASCQLAAVEMALYRLISEQRKAQKRVNALKYNIIPSYNRRSNGSPRPWKRKSAARCSRSSVCARPASAKTGPEAFLRIPQSAT